MDDSTKLRIIKSQSGHNNLLVNGIEMHSRFNPVQEAYEQAQELSEKLKRSPKVLILGIGLGYHVQQIEFKMREFHTTPEIVVIEPNEEIAVCAKESHIIPRKFVRVLCGRHVENYYRDSRFIQFLQMKPLVVPHKPTLDLEHSFFSHFLKYEASSKLKEIIPVLDERVKNLFSDINPEINLYQFLEDIEQTAELDTDKFKLIAFKKLIDSFGHEVVNAK